MMWYFLFWFFFILLFGFQLYHAYINFIKEPDIKHMKESCPKKGKSILKFIKIQALTADIIRNTKMRTMC